MKPSAILCSILACVGCVVFFMAPSTYAYDPSEPLDTLSERRILRFIRNEECPLSSNTDFTARCAYLLKKEFERESDAIEWNFLPRSEKPERGDAVIQPLEEVYEKFRYVKGGKGSKPLEVWQEKSVRNSLLYDQCPITSDQEFLERCLYLFYENEKLLEEIKLEKSGRTSRRTRAIPTVRSLRNLSRYDSVSGEVIRSLEEEAQPEVDFNPFGPGFEPLSKRIEKRLRRYVDELSCPTDLQDEVRIRCDYLVAKIFYQRTKNTRYSRTKLRSLLRVRSDGEVSRRLPNFVQNDYIDAISTVRKRKEISGLRARPRTQADLVEYGEPKVIEGDLPQYLRFQDE